MTPLGRSLPTCPIELVHDRVLEVFDGPLLLLERSVNEGEPYFRVWVDRGDDTERWLLVRVSERDCALFLNQRITLRQIFENVRGGLFYVVDVTRAVRTFSVSTFAEIPSAILPAKDSLHDPELQPVGLHAEQSILLETGWDPAGLADLQRQYVAVYTFLRALTSVAAARLHEAFENFVFEGGWAHKIAFDQLESVISPRERAKFASVQVASPGIMRFDVDSSAADDARKALAHFTKGYPAIRLAYRSLRESIIVHRALIKANGKANAQVIASEKLFDPQLKLLVTLLGGKLDLAILLQACGGPYAASEVVASYFRRLRTLRRFQVLKQADIL